MLLHRVLVGGPEGLSEKPRLLCLSDSEDQQNCLPEMIRESFDIVRQPCANEALCRFQEGGYVGLYIASAHLDGIQRLVELLHHDCVLEGMPDGVALLDEDNTIIWANNPLKQWTVIEDAVDTNFYSALGSPEILGPDFCPFHTALATRKDSSSILRTSDNLYLHVHAAPLMEGQFSFRHLIVAIRDVTDDVLQRQKLEAIHKAGIELADLTAKEVFDMAIDERVELLKSNILHFTKDLLNFNVAEIRLLDEKTDKLESLLSVGLDGEAVNRKLQAKPQENGVTGFVAATGKSYLCEDTAEDPLYLEGLKGARSSLTVPLVFHDVVIGTFNVESPEARAFSESDLQFLELFSRDVAVALNTLELLVAQKANAVQENVEAIHSAVAKPVDIILNNAVNVMEKFIGYEHELREMLEEILKSAREVKQTIQKVGQQMTPAEAVPASLQLPKHPLLKNCRVLVADGDDVVRDAAHDLLEKHGCVVETAHTGGEAIHMVRHTANEDAYDVILADVRLSDMSGHELYLELKKLLDHVPLILMSGFGYDPGHSVVKARQAGLNTNAVLFKPFRLDALLETVENRLKSTTRLSQT